MTADPLVTEGRYLAYVLRHRPDEAGVVLDPAGWVGIVELLRGCEAAGHPLSRERFDAVVAADDKDRFEVVDGRVRAAQGHSVDVDLGLAPQVPPAVLFHGTVDRFLDPIERDGLRPGSRQAVHLSADVATAAVVGGRRGRPVILVVDAAGMHRAGAVFHRASNGVWLTASVEPRWISRHEGDLA